MPLSRSPAVLCQAVVPQKPLPVRWRQTGIPATPMPLLLHTLLAAQLRIRIQRCPCQSGLYSCLQDNALRFQPLLTPITAVLLSCNAELGPHLGQVQSCPLLDVHFDSASTP
jgi:hypothetical protein